MILSLRAYTDSDFERWDSFCDNDAYQATFLHTRRYISYHKKRFKDLSLILEVDGKCIGLFPAAENPLNKLEVVSHPGLSYGGLLFGEKLQGNAIYAALKLIAGHYSSQGYESLIYKAVPTFYHKISAEDDCHALHLLGAKLNRADLTTLIDLNNRAPLSNLRKRSLKKALNHKVEISTNPSCLPELWEVICSNLKKTHNTAPVHSYSEIKLLVDRFPSHIECVSGFYQGSVIAGAILFQTRKVTHTQYVGASELGKSISALDLVLEYSIEKSKPNKSWFDFGISTENQGKWINEGLQNYKIGFGGGNKMHTFFELDLVTLKA